MAVILAACGTSRDSSTAVDDNLNRDLELASSAGVQLAPSGEALQVVSAVERTPEQKATSTKAPKPTPKRATAPRPVPAPVASNAPEPEAELETQAATMAEAPAPLVSETPQAEGPEVATTPVITPTSGPVVIGEGDHGGGRTGGWGGTGTTGTGGMGGGVITRGGTIGDDDHCERHPGGVYGGRPNGGVVIVDRGSRRPPVWTRPGTNGTRVPIGRSGSGTIGRGGIPTGTATTPTPTRRPEKWGGVPGRNR